MRLVCFLLQFSRIETKIEFYDDEAKKEFSNINYNIINVMRAERVSFNREVLYYLEQNPFQPSIKIGVLTTSPNSDLVLLNS